MKETVEGKWLLVGAGDVLEGKHFVDCIIVFTDAENGGTICDCLFERCTITGTKHDFAAEVNRLEEGVLRRGWREHEPEVWLVIDRKYGGGF